MRHFRGKMVLKFSFVPFTVKALLQYIAKTIILAKMALLIAT